jgi:hypothetical protein
MGVMEDIERADLPQRDAKPALSESALSELAPSELALSEPTSAESTEPGKPGARASEAEAPKPAYLVPGNVAWVDGEDFGMAEELYLTIVPDGRTVLLKDTARLIWHVAADGAVNVAEEVAELVSMPVSEIDADVTGFLEDLTARGLLTPREG